MPNPVCALHGIQHADERFYSLSMRGTHLDRLLNAYGQPTTRPRLFLTGVGGVFVGGINFARRELLQMFMASHI